MALPSSTKAKEKHSRTFNQVARVVMLFSRAAKPGAAEWKPKLEEAAGERPTSVALLLLNLFLHICLCLGYTVAEWCNSSVGRERSTTHPNQADKVLRAVYDGR
jgi:hypothetical protein